MNRHRSIPFVALATALVLALALPLSACGARPSAPASAEGDDGDGSGGERAERRRSRDRDRDRDREGDEGEDGDGEFPLGEAEAVAGTGVTFRPPRGSQRAPIGSTFLHARRRIQIVVWASDGDLSAHQQFRTGLGGEAEEVESEEREIDGAPGHLIVDRMTQAGQGREIELERVWVIARRGNRSVAVMGVYDASRSERLRGLVRASVLSVDFEESAPIDPEAALGWRVDPIEGLSLVRTASTNVAYSIDGNPPASGTADPMLFLMPVPVEVPEGERSSFCTEILGQIVQVPQERVTDRVAIDAGEVQGCELQARVGAATEAEGPELATYWALVFRGQGAFMVGATVEAARRREWIERFRGAARTLQMVR